MVAAVPPGLALPKNKIIALSVIGGPSKGLTQRLVKPHISIGRAGGRAEIEIDDPQVSDVLCAVGVKDEMTRLCDLDSHSGTYVESERAWFAALEHLAEFRVGSSLLLVTVLPAQAAPAKACIYERVKKTLDAGPQSLNRAKALSGRAWPVRQSDLSRVEPFRVQSQGSGPQIHGERRRS